MWDEIFADVTINFVKNIEDYMEIRKKFASDLDRYYISIAGKATNMENYFLSPSHLGRIYL